VQLYEELRDPVCRYLARLGVPRTAVDDLCQEAFLRLFQMLREGRQAPNPRAWIFTVARNSGLNAKAAEARTRELDEKDDWPQPGAADPESAILKDEKLARIHRLVQGLPPEQRHCLGLRAEGFRYREIAEIMGVSISSVAGSLRRTVLRIREAIHE
jgi:RNA polymerase sigma-70 factor (ECF subfamily)